MTCSYPLWSPHFPGKKEETSEVINSSNTQVLESNSLSFESWPVAYLLCNSEKISNRSGSNFLESWQLKQRISLQYLGQLGRWINKIFYYWFILLSLLSGHWCWTLLQHLCFICPLPVGSLLFQITKKMMDLGSKDKDWVLGSGWGETLDFVFGLGDRGWERKLLIEGAEPPEWGTAEVWDERPKHGANRKKQTWRKVCSSAFSRGPEKAILYFGNSFVDVLTAKVTVVFPSENPKCVEKELLPNISASV